VEYEGTRYYGFQLQSKLPTIQGELENALWRLTGEQIRTMAASRTDTKVHAKGQVVAFNTSSTLPAQTFVRGLNFYLPEDIAVKACSQVDDNFDPRRQAISREYRYTIINSTSPSPLLRRYTYFVFKPLDVEAMDQACRALMGKHDFAPFTAPSFGKRNTVRTVFKAEVNKQGKAILFAITADSFLPQQVRRTVGSLLRVGLGRMAVGQFYELSRSKTIGLANLTAPPQGLCLTRVNYSNLGFNNG
jgi:tRNA pseudouridine38-40 synthase